MASSETYVLQQPTWLLRDNNKPVCNFIPKVVRVSKCSDDSGTTATFIELELDFGNNSCIKTEINVDDIDRVDWQKIDMRCILNSNYKNARKHIANCIRAQLGDREKFVELPLFSHLGINRYGENKVAFVAGNEVIFPPSEQLQETEYGVIPTGFRLDVDDTITKEDAAKGMLKLMLLSSEIGSITVAYAASGIIRAAFSEVGFTPETVLAIVGASGLLKSHYVPCIAQIYNRKDRIAPQARFNSSKNYLENELYRHRECSVIIDDMNAGETVESIRRAVDKGIEITRQVGDDTGRGKMRGNTSEIHRFYGNAIFIGEDHFGEGSTIPRLLTARITAAPDGRILDHYQRSKPLLVSTFYYYFIKSYVENYYGVCKFIKKHLDEFRSSENEGGTHPRFRDTKFFLWVSYSIFLRFCVECLPEFGECEKEYFDSFKNRLCEIIDDNQKWFSEADQGNNGVDVLKIIKKRYSNEKLKLAENPESFNDCLHDGLIYDKCLCLRRTALERIIREKAPGLRINEAVDQLFCRGALRCCQDKHTIQIYSCGSKRFYSIPLDFLR